MFPSEPELLRQLNVAIDAICADKEKRRRPESEINQKKPLNIANFPGIRVGDILYHADDLDLGVSRYVVVAVDDGTDHCLVVIADNLSHFYDLIRPHWACDWLHRTASAALKERAASDSTYHAAQLKRANKVLSAIAAGGDLSQFVEGVAAEEGPE